ncbi:FAD-binding domain-containing protein [Annulohypoxylon maeteangense]|uniref:FAD-binding domain-containing protein n=1 Tax=Annulohypoxylon maeteangense TaxID=1927788 RepID=UPI0020073FED|nr:FAD-binding domain-containing protein [Annulohypoxylon maeteangense]KAI0881334.1 FAD-binding domain-containing protein [Annulohypoxylon maeteangense]
MALRGLLGLVSLIVVIVAATINYGGTQQCRVIPGDQSWPNLTDWNALNQTVHGKLIATVPIAAPCHHSLGDAATFNQDQCDALRDNWFFPTTHIGSASSPMAYQFTNDSCNPFSDPEVPCTLGYNVAYTINATEVADFQAALQFVKSHNIRLVIRNTGHDYLGRSTGAHALAVWTHHMKSLELIPEYKDDSKYQGAAIKVGAGVEFLELYNFASANGLIVMGGNCPNVGPAGGYTQGGGIGILSSKFGLAADNVLSWEVVTAAGDHVTASANENADLYWALRGGGGGTYGIVTSMTIKAYPDTTFSTVYMSVFNDGSNTDAIYSAMGTFLQSLPKLVDAGAWVVWVAAPFGFLVMPAMVADVKASELDTYFQATREKMDQLGLQYQYQSADYPGFLQGYKSMTSTWNVSDHNVGGRLIPRELVKDQESTDALVKAIRAITTKTLMSGVAFNVANSVSSPDEVSANPYFRKTLFSAVLGTPVNYTDAVSNKAAQDAITHTFLPELEALTPNGGVYMNEADFQAADFKTTFYGGNYEKLLAIKKKYDPDDIFYAKTAVGSDSWEQGVDGRLCTKWGALWEQYKPGFLR